MVRLCVFIVICAAAAQGRAGAQTAPGRNAGGRPVHNEAERAARWKPVVMPFVRAGLSPREQQMILKLADACRLMDELYLRMSDLGGYAMYHATQNADLQRLFAINGSRWDLLDENRPFVGEEPLVPGHEIYPFGLKAAQIEAYAAAHPAEKAAIYSPYTVVRGTAEHLTADPLPRGLCGVARTHGRRPPRCREALARCRVCAVS